MVRAGLLVFSVISTAALWAPAAEADIRIAVAGPMTGVYAWAGERYQRGAGMAVEDLNARGGVLGQRVELVVGDDFCDADQAVALARKFASDDVAFVAAIGAPMPPSLPRKSTRRRGSSRSLQARRAPS